MKKMMKKAVAILIAAICACGCFAGCGRNSNGDKTTISVINFDGGVGSAWLENAARRYEKLHENDVYEDGKVGVYIDIEKSMNTMSSTMNTSATDIYFDEANANLGSLIPSGYLLDIDDIVKEKNDTRDGQPISIEDKIFDLSKGVLKGNDGHYYALPHYTWYPGLTYDVETFDYYGFYIAKPGATSATQYTSKFGTCSFTNVAADKSCGNDGVYGTADDGMPSSLTELIVLCSYMKKSGVTPFIVAGAYPQYANYLVEGLWTSLAGNEMDICYTFDGETQLVTGFKSDEYLFGTDYIPAPLTSTEIVTEKTGYKAYDQVTRYYATSFLKMIEAEGWFSNSSTTGTVYHTDAQSEFIFGGTNNKPRIGMMIEGSYWYNESVACENFEDYYALTEKTDRDLKWMPLPTSFDTPATEGNGRTYKVLETGISFAFINANVTKKGEKFTALCKDFFQFLYSDAELKAMTVESGSARGLDYSLDDSDYDALSGFQRSVWDLRENAEVLYCGADNKTFNNSFMNFKLNMFTPVFQPTVSGTRYTNILAAIRGGKTVTDIFEATRMTAGSWSSLYVE